jgi:predicted RNA-binding protein YlqC (UPF0109 family)
MSEIDQQFIEYVVKSLVGKPDAVHTDRRIDEKGVLLELTVDPEDLGRVIGKRGATAQSLRTLLRALGTKNDARYNLKIIDNGPLDHGRTSDDDSASAKSEPADDRAPIDDTPATDTDETASNVQAEEADESQPEEPAAPEVSEQPEEEPDQEPETPDENQTSDRMAQTRKELADLDDLDV